MMGFILPYVFMLVSFVDPSGLGVEASDQMLLFDGNAGVIISDTLVLFGGTEIEIIDSGDPNHTLVPEYYAGAELFFNGFTIGYEHRFESNEDRLYIEIDTRKIHGDN